MFKSKFVIVLIVVLISVVGMIGCSNSNEENNQEISNHDNMNNETNNETEKAEEIVTLQVYDRILLEDQFNRFVLEPVQKQFPNVRLERIEPVGTGANIDQLQNFVTTGTVPDIFLRYIAGTSHLTDLEIPQDLSELAKKYNLDINQYEPVIVETLSRYGNLSDEPYEVLALPLYSQFQVMIYNKEIFDMFAEPYPEDGMTYPEFINVVKKLTREQDGVQYFGSGLSWNGLAYQLSLGLVDPETNRALVNQLDEYHEIFSLGKKFFEIEGMAQS